MSSRLAIATASIALLFAGSAFAQQQPMPAPSAPQQTLGAAATEQPGRELSRRDREFVRHAAQGGLAEVELGRLAQRNAGTDDVRQFGARMVRDHSAANDQLEQVARAQGLTLPQQLDRKHLETRERLSRLHGAAFDQAYIRDMVRDHNEDIREFRREAQSGRDPAVRQFAARTLPVLEQHDQMAHEVERSLTAVGSSVRR